MTAPAPAAAPAGTSSPSIPVLVWLAGGIAAVSLVTLIDVSRLLGAIQSDGARSYNASVFTGLKFLFWDTADLRDAMDFWRRANPDVIHLLKWHLKVDMVPFVWSYCFLVKKALERVGAKSPFPVRMALSLWFVDELETEVTYWVLVGRGLNTTSNCYLIAVQFLALVKWLLVAAVLVILLLFLWNRVWAAVRDAREGWPHHPGIALSGLIVLAGLFAALVALPAGGPLEQIADVLRYLLSREVDWTVRLWSVGALLLLALAFATAGLAATDPQDDHAKPTKARAVSPPEWSSRHVFRRSREELWITLGYGLVFFAWFNCTPLLSWVHHHPHRPFYFVPGAPFAVALGVALGAFLAEAARQCSRPQPTIGGRTFHDETILWIGALAGVVIVAGALGLVRAALPPVVLEMHAVDDAVSWWVATVVGCGFAVGGGLAAQWAVRWATRRIDRKPYRMWRRLGPHLIVCLLTFGFAGRLIAEPTWAADWGTTGVVAIGFASLAVVVGFLRWCSRHFHPWEATRALGFSRTPWLLLLVAWWVVGSIMNTDGVYHDVRVWPTPGPPALRHADIDAAFTRWLQSQADSCPQAPDGAWPLVLVAAPGGGIRAAYWTAATLDALFPPRGRDCAVQRLFAVSGVSGGSVGAVTWLQARAADSSGKNVVRALSRDAPLATAVAGLLLRDLLQPLTAIRTGVRDRAALLEDGWAAAAPGLYGPVGNPKRWSTVGDGLSWVPVLVLNASSVLDGCRVLVANVGTLPAATGSDCGASRLERRASGPLTASIDALSTLHRRADNDTTVCGSPSAELGAVTAALLSARFSYVTPSGALVRCVSDTVASGRDTDTVRTSQAVTYTVDGGYYENSGLLSLLQIWVAIEPRVRWHNETVYAQRRKHATQPMPSSMQLVVPWIVIVDNHYRSKARSAESRRPFETVVPLRTIMNNNRILAQPALEQMAAVAIGSDRIHCTVQGGGEVPDTTSVPDTTFRDAARRGCVVVIAPTQRPSVEAPLGWVLSETSRDDLDSQLVSLSSGPKADPGFQNLLKVLGR
jgi:hypothetical protein